MVLVRHGSKVLGEVPAINLLRVRYRDLVRFAGKRWQVQKASSDFIILQPTTASGKAVDFVYPGGGVGFDGFLTDRMWKIFHNEDFALRELTPNLRATLARARSNLGKNGRVDQIPFIRTGEGIQYFTFSSHLVNKAIALFTGQLDYNADDISLQVISPIEWKSVPDDPKDYEPVFDQLFEASSEQSLFQSLLPIELQRREFLQGWLRDESIMPILARLKHSTPKRIEMNFLQ